MRQYNPRRNRRGGISPKAKTFLSFLLAVAIALQISYPLISGEPLRLATIATVYFGAAAMSLHALFAYGARYAFPYLAITLFFGLFIEQLGLKTGWPFGNYSYDGTLGFQIYGVPLVVPFAWAMMAHPVLIVARRVTKHWVFLYGGIAMMAWDLFLDPQMVAAGRWSWVFTGSHVPFEKEIPISNAFGWLLAGMGLTALLHISLPRERRKESANFSAVDIFLGWTLFSGVIGNLFFFDRPGVALFGGLILGTTLAPYFFSRWLGRP
ncbi:MAG: carotenoid biosynthesis protein [Actinobacteria bacterium]|nr:carotenoid biosynthesis protein [Actinomycetota bacterium]